MLSLAFLNPLLLWAVPLCSVPIVIHLLNRRRFKKVPWAAMEYLLAAMKRNRKRLRMEQWLVLLLRTLAVLLLVGLVSRPQFGGGLLGTKVHHVVVLDDSASMTQRSGSTTLFVKAQDRVRTLADELSLHRGGDLFSLVRTSHATQPELWRLRVGPDLGKRVGTLLKELQVGDGSPDLGAALQTTVKRAAEVQEAGKTTIYVVGDARACDWSTEDDKPKPAMLAAFVALRPDQDRVLVLGAAGPPANLGVVDVRLVDRIAVVGVPATIAVDVQNFGLDPTAASTVAVEVDGQSRVTLTVPPLAPNQRQAIPLGHTFHQAGPHRVDAQLEASESFPLDDHRALALDVREKSRVLVVDGEPDDEVGETLFLQTAMEGELAGIDAQVVTDQNLEETDFKPFDVLWLCNVRSFSAATGKRIEEFVAGGGGLVIFAGALVDAPRYDELLWRDGQGVLPLPYGDVAGDPDRPEKAVLTNRDHPVCQGVSEVFDVLLGNVVQVHRWLQIVEDKKRDASIVARIRDAEGPPLLVTRTFGNGGGEVAMFAVSADNAWSTMPSTDLFVPLVIQLHRTCARRQDVAGQNLLPDGVWRLTLDPAVHRSDATLRAKSGDDEHTFTAVEQPEKPGQPGQPGGAAVLTVPMSELRQLGAYEIELVRHDGAPDKRMIARNVPSVEGRLVGFADSAFARLYPAELQGRVVFVRDDDGKKDETGEGEAWPLIAALLLVGMLAETLLAWRFGRR